MLLRWQFLLLCGLLLAGCSGLSGQNLPPVLPTELFPTWIAQTEQARAESEALFAGLSSETPTPDAQGPSSEDSTGAEQREPTATLAALGPSPTSTHTATLTPTQIPAQPTLTPSPLPRTSIPEAAIQFRNPGPMSRLISPLQVRASVQPGLDGRVRVELLGEDGRLLVRKIINYGETKGWVFLSEALDFEISAAAETGRLVISTYDTYGRLNALGALDVILLSMGEDDLNPPGGVQEAVIVLEPLPNKLIQGGTLMVNGLTSLPPEIPLLVELVTVQGTVVGYRQAGIPLDPEGGYVPFTAEVPYQVDSPTWVRLTIRQESSGRIPGTVYATSFEVLLSP